MTASHADWLGGHPTERKVDLAPGELFDLLSNQRAREVLLRLEREQATSVEPAVAFNDLVDRVVAMEVPAPEDFDADDRKRVYVSLQQTHIPKLEAAGLVALETDEDAERDDGRENVRVLRPTADLRAIANMIRAGETACTYDDAAHGSGIHAPGRARALVGGGGDE